ncbi:hypothetical protein ACI65C_006431 [Semiaphis heraclei]
MRQGCEAGIYLKASDDGKALVITKMTEDHNHKVSQVLYSHLPNQRKITPESKAIVLELMDLKANKKMIQQKIMNKSGKIVTLKDLSNIHTTGRKNYSNNNLVETVDKLKNKFNCTVEISTDEENNLNGIFIQDSFMTESFEAYPEVVFADATYKLLDLRLPVYELMTEDGNGQSEIAAIGLLVNEEEITLRWFFETLKKYNPISAKTRVYITDKDMKERNVITFNREITCDKRNMTPNERDTAKEIIQNIIYCKSELEYDNLYQHLKTVAPETVIEYYNKNWHGIRDEWVIGMTYMTGNFMNKTNNKLESFNGKLKSVISCSSTLEHFVKKLFIVHTDSENFNSQNIDNDVAVDVVDVNHIMDAVENTDSENFNSQNIDNDVAVDVVDVNHAMDAVEITDYNKLDNYPENNVVNVLLPGKVRTCGRPKGAILTTIGIPKRPRTTRTLAQKSKTKIKREIRMNQPIVFVLRFHMER